MHRLHLFWRMSRICVMLFLWKSWCDFCMVELQLFGWRRCCCHRRGCGSKFELGVYSRIGKFYRVDNNNTACTLLVTNLQRNNSISNAGAVLIASALEHRDPYDLYLQLDLVSCFSMYSMPMIHHPDIPRCSQTTTALMSSGCWICCLQSQNFWTTRTRQFSRNMISMNIKSVSRNMLIASLRTQQNCISNSKNSVLWNV